MLLALVLEDAEHPGIRLLHACGKVQRSLIGASYTRVGAILSTGAPSVSAHPESRST